MLYDSCSPMHHKGLAGWDYTTRSNYMITLVADPRQPIFGTCREWGIEWAPLSKAIYDAWQQIGARFPQVKATYYTIMPDHFHGILYVTERLPEGLGTVVDFFVAEAERRAGQRLFARLFRDSICLARGQLSRMIHYVLANPSRKWIKMTNHDLFRRRHFFRHCRLPDLGGTSKGEYWDVETGTEITKPRKANRLLAAFCGGAPGTMIARWRRERCRWWALDAQGQVLPRQRCVETAGEWTAMGNPFLLDAPLIVSVRISTAVPPEELARVKEKALARAARGCVMAGGWISPGEKSVREALLDVGASIVQMVPEPMGSFYRPGGRNFELCAEGRLLLLSPFGTEVASGRDAVDKARFEWLNGAARALADTAVGWARPV